MDTNASAERLQEALEAVEAGESPELQLARLGGTSPTDAAELGLALALTDMRGPNLSRRDRAAVLAALLEELDRAVIEGAPRIPGHWRTAAGFVAATGVLLAVAAVAAAAVLGHVAQRPARLATSVATTQTGPQDAAPAGAVASPTVATRRAPAHLLRLGAPTASASPDAGAATGPERILADRDIVILPFGGPSDASEPAPEPGDRPAKARAAEGVRWSEASPPVGRATRRPNAATAIATPAATDSPAPPLSPTAIAVVGIAGRVVDPTGAAIVGAIVRSEPLDADGAAFELTRTDAAGRFALELRAGTYRVRAEAPGFDGRWFDGAAEASGALAVVVATGSAPEIVIVLPPALLGPTPPGAPGPTATASPAP